MDYLSRAAIRDPIKFELASVHTWACKKLVRVAHLGSAGLIDKDSAPSYAIGLKALMGILDRTAPIPKAGIEAHLHGDLVIAWQPSPSPIAPEQDKPRSMIGSNGSDPVRRSSSATDALANL